MMYSFNLEFSDLDDELQNSKIDEVIHYDYEVGNLEREDENGKQIDVCVYLNDEDLRNKTQKYIETHFPIYF